MGPLQGLSELIAAENLEHGPTPKKKKKKSRIWSHLGRELGNVLSGWATTSQQHLYNVQG